MDAASHLRPGRKTRPGKIWLVSFSGAPNEPAVNWEEIRSVHT